MRDRVGMTTRIIPDDAVFATGQAQRGVIARYQLLRSHSKSETDDLLRSGWFERLLRGVHRFRGGDPAPEQLAFAAALRARPRATITGPLALGLLGVPGFSGSAPFEILVQPTRSISGLAVRHRVDPVPDRAVATYGEVRVAGPLDALIDSASFLDQITERDLRVAWDHLRGKGLTTIDRLERRCADLRHLVPGVLELERVLEAAGGVVLESEGERALAPFVWCFEPAFEPQVWVLPRRRVDFYCRRCRYGYEYLGEVDHAYVAARIADDERDDELRRAGIRLGYVTKEDLREPQSLVASMAATLTVRAHELGVSPPVAVRPPAL